MNRFQPVGWYTLLGLNRFRENAIEIVRSTGSLSGSGLHDPATYDPKA